MAVGLQANAASQIQWLGRPNSIHHGQRSYHSFGLRRWPYHGKILHHDLRRSSSKLVLSPILGLHHKLASAKGKTQAGFPRLRATRPKHHRKLPVSPRRQKNPSMITFGDSSRRKLPKKDAIAKCIAGLLPGQLASHLSREPPRTLSDLYAEAEKYARSDADHRRRVEQRRIMRQAEKQNWNYQNKNPQFVFPVESSQETSPEQDQDPFMTPPNKSPEGQHNNQD